jgi:hypothetical protein
MVLALQRTAGNASVVALVGASRRQLSRAPKESPLLPHIRARAENKAELRQAVRDLEGELDGAVSVWEDTIRKAGDQEIRRESWLDPHGLMRRRPGRMGPPPGSRNDRLNRREWVRTKLEEVRDGGGAHAAEAGEALRDLDDIGGRLERARLELARAGRRDASTIARPRKGGGDGPGGDGGDGGGGGGGQPADETARVEDRAALDAEAELAQGVIKGEASLVTRMTTRVASFLADMLPGPLEVLQLVQGFASGYTGAWDSIRDRSTREGFAAGFTACMLQHDYGWVRGHLYRWEVSADVATHVVGAEGMAERAFNEALLIGYEYCENRSVEHLAKLRNAVFHALAHEGFSVADDENAFDERTVRAVSVQLMPLVDALFAKVARRREEQAASARAASDRAMGERWEARVRP